MKQIKNYSFILIFFALIGYGTQYNTLFGMESNQSEKDAIVFDLDETLIDVDEWNAYRSILWQSLPWNFMTLLRLKSQRLPDKHGNKRWKAQNSEDFAPGGGATSLGFYGLSEKTIPMIFNV